MGMILNGYRDMGKETSDVLNKINMFIIIGNDI
jgi:hypothetical protein